MKNAIGILIVETSVRGRGKPVKNSFFVSYSLMGLWDTSPVCFRSLVFWGPTLQVEVSTVRLLDVSSNHMAPQGEAGVVSSFSIVTVPAVRYIMRVCLRPSCFFSVDILLFP